MALLKYIYRLLSLLLLVPLFCSCYQDFDPDIASTPVVCINATAVAGDTLSVRVTRTWRWNEGKPGDDLDIFLKDAQVKLYVNDTFREDLVYSEWEEYDPWEFSGGMGIKKAYKSTYVPQPGDRIRITAEDPQYGFAEGSVAMPLPPTIDDVKIQTSGLTQEEYGSSTMYNGSANVELYFTDPAQSKDFYFLDCSAEYESDNSYDAGFLVDMSGEPLFTEHVSSMDAIISETSGYTFFTDRQISGKSYPLHIRFQSVRYEMSDAEGPDSNKSCVILELNTISESMYRHVISVWESNDGVQGALGDIGLADHIWESSNVSTGAGLISARTPTRLAIPLSRLLSLSH